MRRATAGCAVVGAGSSPSACPPLSVCRCAVTGRVGAYPDVVAAQGLVGGQAKAAQGVLRGGQGGAEGRTWRWGGGQQMHMFTHSRHTINGFPNPTTLCLKRAQGPAGAARATNTHMLSALQPSRALKPPPCNPAVPSNQLLCTVLALEAA